MKDKQAKVAAPASQIPVISPVLHFLSMPVVVFWRSHFGYSYLRPKSVFLASVVACAVFWTIVRGSPSLARFETLSRFFALASVLYLFHLLVSLWRESRSKASHDQYSGTSHLLRFLPQETVARNPKVALRVQWLLEPTLTWLAGLVLSTRSEPVLGEVLCWMGAGLFLKESIRVWLAVRRKKRQADVLDDAEEATTPSVPASTPAPARSSRKPRTRRPRSTEADSEMDSRRHRFMEILRLLPPYSLEDAERNFRILIKEAHPDQAGESSEAGLRTRELTEAIEYFRAKLG